MADRPYAFTAEATREILDATRQVRAAPIGRLLPDAPPAIVAPVVVFCRITSTTKVTVDGRLYYPAKLCRYSHQTGVTTDLGDMYIYDPN